MKVITVEMVIGLKYYPNQFNESFSFVTGLVRTPKAVHRLGLGALGRYLPQDIGKIVKNGQVENEEQITRRTGLNTVTRKLNGEAAIIRARRKYKGQKNIWGLTI